MKNSIYKTSGLYSQEEFNDLTALIMDDYDEDEDGNIIAYNEISRYFEDLMEDIRYNKISNEILTVNGVLGLWDGKRTIKPVRMHLEQIIYACIEDCDEFELYEEDGALKLDAYHHDGTNCFTITRCGGENINLISELYN